MKEKLTKFWANKTMQSKIHWVLLATTALFFLAGLFIFLRWNQGVDSDYDAAATTTDYDVEALDFIMMMDPALLAGRKDDGELHILCLGNNPFSDDRGPTGLAALIAEETGGVTYNGAFPDSTVASKTSVQEPQDAFGLYYVTIALVNKYYSFLRQYAFKMDDPRYLEAADTLAGVDMEKIDVIIIMYDTTDYNRLSPADDPNNEYNMNAFTGSLRVSIEFLQKFYPHIRIILMSHTYAQYLDEDGQLHNGTTTDLGNGDVVHYLIMESDVAIGCGITFIDNYFGSINEDNYAEYMRDHMHLNEAGRRLLAKRVAAVLND